MIEGNAEMIEDGRKAEKIVTTATTETSEIDLPVAILLRAKPKWMMDGGK